MKKFIALFSSPSDVDGFLAHYHDVHLPLVAKLPGLVRTEVTRIEKTLTGQQGFFLLTEMFFEDQASLDAALHSSENAAVAADGNALAGDIVTLMLGDTTVHAQG